MSSDGKTSQALAIEQWQREQEIARLKEYIAKLDEVPTVKAYAEERGSILRTLFGRDAGGPSL